MASFSGNNEVYNFLEEIGKAQFYPKFEEVGYDTIESLQYIALKDLTRDMGIPIGHARMILARCAKSTAKSTPSVCSFTLPFYITILYLVYCD